MLALQRRLLDLGPQHTFHFPFEIVAEILRHACQVERKGDISIFSTSPLFLCQVCKSWKRYLITTPKFWSTIIVVLRKSTLRSLNFNSGLARWLRRSGDLPLDIFLDGIGAIPFQGSQILEALKLIANVRARWRGIELHCASPSLCESLLELVDNASKTKTDNLPSSPYPFLKSFALTARTGSVFSQFDLMDAKYLSTLVINGCPSSFTGLIKHRPANITQLILKNIEGMALNRVLHWYSKLSMAEFQFVQVHPASQGFPDDELTHHHLQTLVIEGESWADVVCVIHPLRAPQLKRLILIVQTTPKLNFQPDIHSFVLRSACTLSQLQLSILAHEEETLTKTLLLLPTLRELHIQQIDPSSCLRGLSRVFFDSFYPLTASATTFLPNLQSFTYVGNLSVDSVDFLEPFVLRAQGVPRQGTPPYEGFIRKLTFAKIQADQSRISFKNVGQEDMSNFLFQVLSLVEAERLWLLSPHGMPWGLLY